MIHWARSANLRSTFNAPSAEIAVISGVSIDSIRTDIRTLGVSPSCTSTSARSPGDGIVAPAGDQSTCTGSIIGASVAVVCDQERSGPSVIPRRRAR